ncbi:hypothetical protein Ae201684P_015800 [Aphanomyces euteiches]|uniref:Uncharacterized protein n=1 Tax=Aphanomyces euteiches TaxID=100861 RepID=A0A6G0WIR9_9STRA|nr:hypothetical protein Ae201684_014832 [Aphanomyces euteiches]KAH9072728.1 hypothetical protein Ae201684P_015800 [Aphanomyces euteiches]KAH9134676.1 hypothetical protein AeRB84_019615 [Aphanomyces euteiches]
MNQQCSYAKCAKPVLPGYDRCNTHRYRRLCVVQDCANQSYARGFCIRHGGKKKCAHADCKSNAFVGEFCARHDTLQRTCCVLGCTNPVPAQEQSSRQDFPSWRLCLDHLNVPVVELESMLPLPEFLEFIDEVVHSMTDNPLDGS